MANRAKLAKNAVAKKERKEKVEKRESNGITMKAVHAHYNCNCPYYPRITVVQEDDEEIITIPLQKKCPSCKKGCLFELVIGNYVHPTNGVCEEPGCKCEKIAHRMELSDFLDCLREV